MKTDLQKFQDLMESFGLHIEVGDRNGYSNITYWAQENRKVGGYSGFAAEFIFSRDGKFLKLDIWE